MRVLLPVLLLGALYWAVDGATGAFASREAEGGAGTFLAWVAAGCVSLVLLAAHLTLTVVRDARRASGR